MQAFFSFHFLVGSYITEKKSVCPFLNEGRPSDFGHVGFKPDAQTNCLSLKKSVAQNSSTETHFKNYPSKPVRILLPRRLTL